jgi:hypothetical protein
METDKLQAIVIAYALEKLRDNLSPVDKYCLDHRAGMERIPWDNWPTFIEDVHMLAVQKVEEL